MKERPILFSGPMIRALQAGTKTQTRRVNGLDVINAEPDRYDFIGITSGPGVPHFAFHDKKTSAQVLVKCPYGQPGDRLWVRETFCLEHSVEADQPPPFNDGRPIKRRNEDDCNEFDPLWLQAHYKATDPTPELCYEDAPTDDPMVRWKPSIHMPRWASRITLEITAVRVERLQDISEADAIAEGIERGVGFPGWYRGPLPGDGAGLEQYGRDFKIPTAFPKLAYRALWEQINGPGSWDANPWVWVVEFKRVTP